MSDKTYPKMSEMIAVLPGFSWDTADQVYRYESNGPNCVSRSVP